MNYVKRILLVAGLLIAGTVQTVHAQEAFTVNINTADAVILAQHLDGIGAARAAAIVEFRRQNGPFRTVDELLRVPGIGAVLLERNRHKIRVSDPPAEADLAGGEGLGIDANPVAEAGVPSLPASPEE